MSKHRAVMYKMELVEEIRKRLRALPEPTRDHVTKIDLVRELAGEIAEQQKRGHSTERIAELMAASGVPFTSSTLKTYLCKAKPQPRKPRRRRWRDSAEALALTPESLATSPGEDMLAHAAKPARGVEGDREENPETEPAFAATDRGAESVVVTEEDTGLTPGSRPKLQASSDGREGQADGGVARVGEPTSRGRLQAKLKTTSPEAERLNEASVSTPEEAVSTSPLQGGETVRETPAPRAARAGATPRIEKSLKPGEALNEPPRLTSGATDAAREKDARVPRRLTSGEIDRSRSTFVPREDTRDI